MVSVEILGDRTPVQPGKAQDMKQPDLGESGPHNEAEGAQLMHQFLVTDRPEASLLARLPTSKQSGGGHLTQPDGGNSGSFQAGGAQLTPPCSTAAVALLKRPRCSISSGSRVPCSTDTALDATAFSSGREVGLDTTAFLSAKDVAFAGTSALSGRDMGVVGTTASFSARTLGLEAIACVNGRITGQETKEEARTGSGSGNTTPTARSHSWEKGVLEKVQSTRTLTSAQKEQMAAKILEFMGPAVYAFDTQGNVNFWAAPAQRMFEYEEEEVLGNNICRLVVPEETLPVADYIVKNYLIKGGSWAGELPGRTRDGRVSPTVFINTPMLDDNGQLWGIVGVAFPAQSIFQSLPPMFAAPEPSSDEQEEEEVQSRLGQQQLQQQQRQWQQQQGKSAQRAKQHPAKVPRRNPYTQAALLPASTGTHSDFSAPQPRAAAPASFVNGQPFSASLPPSPGDQTHFSRQQHWSPVSGALPCDQQCQTWALAPARPAHSRLQHNSGEFGAKAGALRRREGTWLGAGSPSPWCGNNTGCLRFNKGCGSFEGASTVEREASATSGRVSTTTTATRYSQAHNCLLWCANSGDVPLAPGAFPGLTPGSPSESDEDQQALHGSAHCLLPNAHLQEAHGLAGAHCEGTARQSFTGCQGHMGEGEPQGRGAARHRYARHLFRLSETSSEDGSGLCVWAEGQETEGGSPRARVTQAGGAFGAGWGVGMKGGGLVHEGYPFHCPAEAVSGWEVPNGEMATRQQTQRDRERLFGLHAGTPWASARPVVKALQSGAAGLGASFAGTGRSPTSDSTPPVVQCASRTPSGGLEQWDAVVWPQGGISGALFAGSVRSPTSDSTAPVVDSASDALSGRQDARTSSLPVATSLDPPGSCSSDFPVSEAPAGVPFSGTDRSPTSGSVAPLVQCASNTPPGSLQHRRPMALPPERSPADILALGASVAGAPVGAPVAGIGYVPATFSAAPVARSALACREQSASMVERDLVLQMDSAGAQRASGVREQGASVVERESMVRRDSALRWRIEWEEIQLGMRLGEGLSGSVYKASWKGVDVAVKVFSPAHLSRGQEEEFRREAGIMESLRHPNVVLYMGAIESPLRRCIVSEFMPRGSLFRVLQRSASHPLSLLRRLRMALGAARGVYYLHSCSPPIVHHDLKSANLLVDRDWTVKVADFGLSKFKLSAQMSAKSARGTPQWMAPEVLRTESSGEKSDVYSFGVILWELVTRQVPWDGLNPMQVVGAVGFMEQRLLIPSAVCPDMRALINSCWHRDPAQRPDFKGIIDALQRMECHEETRKAGAHTPKE